MQPRALGTGIAYTSIGSMDKWITITQPGTVNNLGVPAADAVFASCWASLIAVKGEEAVKSDQVVQKAYYQVRMNYLPGLAENMTVQFEGKNFRILYVEDVDARQVEHRLMVLETNENI